MLKQSTGVEVKVYDPFGWMGVLPLNHLYPPFDDLKLRRALLPAVDQHAFVQSIVGEQSDLGRVSVKNFSHAEARRSACHVGDDEASCFTPD